MADLQTINIGNLVNDGLGDDLRTAFLKVNANFADLNDELTVIGVNVGTTGAEIYKQKTDNGLEFRNLVSGHHIQLDQFEDSIVIQSTAPDAFQSITAGAPVGNVIEASAFPNITIQGGDDIEFSGFGSVITANTVLPVTKILTYYDFGFLNGDYTNSIQVALQAANIEFGTITYAGRMDIDCGPLIT
jgi:hypothetical protein